MKFLTQLLFLDVGCCVLPPGAVEWFRQALRLPPPGTAGSRTPLLPQDFRPTTAPKQHDFFAFHGELFPFAVRPRTSDGIPGHTSAEAETQPAASTLHAVPKMASLVLLDMHSCCLSGQFDSLLPLATAVGAHPCLEVWRVDGNDLPAHVCADIARATKEAFEAAQSDAQATAHSFPGSGMPRAVGSMLFLGSGAPQHPQQASSTAAVRVAASPHLKLSQLQQRLCEWPYAPSTTQQAAASKVQQGRGSGGGRANSPTRTRSRTGKQATSHVAHADGLQFLAWQVACGSEWHGRCLQLLPLEAGGAAAAQLSTFHSSGAGVGNCCSISLQDIEQGSPTAVLWCVASSGDAGLQEMLHQQHAQWHVQAHWSSLAGTEHTTQLAQISVGGFASSRRHALDGDELVDAAVASQEPGRGPPRQLWYSTSVRLPSEACRQGAVRVTVRLLDQNGTPCLPADCVLSQPELPLAGDCSGAVLL